MKWLMQPIEYKKLLASLLVGFSLGFLAPHPSYGQDISLPPLPVDPSGNLDVAALPPTVEKPTQSFLEPALPNVSDAQAADNLQKLADRSQVLQTRAAEDSLDDLIPAANKSSANPSVNPASATNTTDITNTSGASGASGASGVSGVASDAALNVPAKVDSTAAVPAHDGTATVNPAVQNTQNDVPVKELTSKDDALQGLPVLPDPLASTQPKKPLTLEEEAAAAGLIRPESNEDLPDLSAQALLSGQPLAPDDEEDLVQKLPEEKVKKSTSYRDVPKLRPVIQPLRHSFNYHRTTLPPSIYRKQYSGDNQYLPLATYREDYDRALFYAVAANDINGTRAFLERGANINMANIDGDTLLITAVRYRAFDTARLLLARGANPTIQGSGGVTAIQYAIASKQSELATILRARGA